jgi:hypothetical protein
MHSRYDEANAAAGLGEPRPALDSWAAVAAAVSEYRQLERLFVEVPRRIRTMCAFTTRDLCERILVSVFDRVDTH